MLIVLDRSSSMVTGRVGKQTKWKVATDALGKLLGQQQASMEFGLMLFPFPDQCGPGKVKVKPGLDQKQPIMDELRVIPPAAGNWTPMAQSLNVAGRIAALKDEARGRHVLLITDGWQWCAPYDVSSRFAPVQAVKKLKKLGIKTHVVGFGQAVDALTLNKMAEAAGTERTKGCKANGNDPASGKNCYYQADNPDQLLGALENIAVTITNEVCDGLDNDCDGAVDEELEGPSCSVQLGVCAGATKACGGKTEWVTCGPADFDDHATRVGLAYETDEVTCDGMDNDCDGAVDENCACTAGDTRVCGVNFGACREGTQTCTGGQWSSCTGGVQAAEEVCDGLDNDCDGTVDGPTVACADEGVCIEGICVQPTGGGCECSLDGRAGGGATGALLLLLAGALVAGRRRRSGRRRRCRR